MMQIVCTIIWTHMKGVMKTFGVPLKQAPRLPGHQVPLVIEKLLDYLQSYALDSEGLFRVPGDWAEVYKLRGELDNAPEDVDLKKYDFNTIAEVLKKYFAELPESLVPPLIDQHVKALFIGEKRKTREEIMREIKFAVDSLSEESYSILERLGKFMAVLVSFASRNKMNLANLAACIAPTLKFTPAIFTYCVQYHSYFFNSQAPQTPAELRNLANNPLEDKRDDKSLPRHDTPNPPTRNEPETPPSNRDSRALRGRDSHRDSTRGEPTSEGVSRESSFNDSQDISTQDLSSSRDSARDLSISGDASTPSGRRSVNSSYGRLSLPREVSPRDPSPRSMALTRDPSPRDFTINRDQSPRRHTHETTPETPTTKWKFERRRESFPPRQNKFDYETSGKEEEIETRRRSRTLNSKDYTYETSGKEDDSERRYRETRVAKHRERRRSKQSPTLFCEEPLLTKDGRENRPRSEEFTPTGVDRSSRMITPGENDITVASEQDERQAKKKYYKEEMVKLVREVEIWKSVSQVHKEKIDELTERNFDLDAQLKKQKLKNKELQLDIEMLQRKLKKSESKEEVNRPRSSSGRSKRDYDIEDDKKKDRRASVHATVSSDSYVLENRYTEGRPTPKRDNDKL